MDPQPVFYDKTAFVSTKIGNIISKKAVLHGSDKIYVRGKSIIEPGAVIRGDQASVTICQFCMIGENTILKPSDQGFKGGSTIYPLKIGEYTIIERDCIIEALTIGACVHIGKGCTISKRCILSACCRVEDDSILAPGTVVPPFTVFSGNPARMMGRLPETYELTAREHAMEYYKYFLPTSAFSSSSSSSSSSLSSSTTLSISSSPSSSTITTTPSSSTSAVTSLTFSIATSPSLVSSSSSSSSSSIFHSPS
eukprot:TRINITY_DN463_c0_g2_i1.p1 TRINITY_DN463_c0_g2~~TRINITY_DN463_c0_g2_i1.p1  ORF type:complete len:252 (-),score=77.58 TRINITY_DN463_c0_g2_i1:58-813(-)